MKVGFQNLLFLLGSYLNGYYGDGAFLTVIYATSWIFLFTGIGFMASSASFDLRNYERRERDQNARGRWSKSLGKTPWET